MMLAAAHAGYIAVWGNNTQTADEVYVLGLHVVLMKYLDYYIDSCN